MSEKKIKYYNLTFGCHEIRGKPSYWIEAHMDTTPTCLSSFPIFDERTGREIMRMFEMLEEDERNKKGPLLEL